MDGGVTSRNKRRRVAHFCVRKLSNSLNAALAIRKTNGD